MNNLEIIIKILCFFIAITVTFKYFVKILQSIYKNDIIIPNRYWMIPSIIWTIYYLIILITK